MCECLSLRKVWGKKGFYRERKDRKRREQEAGYGEGADTVSYAFPSWTWNCVGSEKARNLEPSLSVREGLESVDAPRGFRIGVKDEVQLDPSCAQLQFYNQSRLPPTSQCWFTWERGLELGLWETLSSSKYLKS
ncbi:hypothetical protein CMV_003997 [Castanea mollissima]|uniref:Uncharacterized protein n=1 Tax=Castanea mollissima TaxID=60419 RepID=A0A8J4RZ10_9ROSI|nr:hypothetical protein CMV_003997 [Castanea mollissima]